MLLEIFHYILFVRVLLVADFDSADSSTTAPPRPKINMEQK